MRNPASPSKPRFLSLAARIWYWRERHAMLDRFARPNFHPIRTVLAICIFLITLFPRALFSQQSSSPRGATPIWPMHDSSPAHGLPDAMPNMRKGAAICGTGNSMAPKLTCAKPCSYTRGMRKRWSCWDNCWQPATGPRMPSACVLKLPAWIRILFPPTSVWRMFPANYASGAIHWSLRITPSSLIPCKTCTATFI